MAIRTQPPQSGPVTPTYAVSGAAGANAHLVPALAGLVLVNAMVIGASRLVARRRSEARPA